MLKNFFVIISLLAFYGFANAESRLQQIQESGKLRVGTTGDPDAVKSLQQINWTGNIRQLRNVMERLHILGDHRITAQDVYLHTTSKENS